MKTTEKTLRDHLYEAGGNPLSWNNVKFSSWAEKLPQDIREQLIDQIRDHRDFYKRVLQEKYREKNPNSLRYEDAEKKIAIANEKGKILKSIIDNFKNRNQ